MNVAVALFLVLSSLGTAEPEVCSPPQEKPPNPPPEDAIVVEHSTHGVKQVLDRARDVKEHAQEAVSEALSKAKDFVPRKTSEVSDVIRAACRISYDFSQTTANKVSSAVTKKVVPTVNQYVPGERGRAKIGRFATSFVRNAAVYGLPEVLKYWVPAEDSKQKVKEVLDKAREVKEHAKGAVSEALIKAKDSVGYRTSEVSNKAKDVIGATYQISYDFSRTTAAKVSGAVTEKIVPTVNQYVPDERGRAKIGRFATSFVKNAAVYGLPVVLRYWFPDETAEDSKQKVKEVLDKAGEVKEHAKEAVSEALIKAKDSFGYRTSKVSNKAKDVFRAAYQIFYDFSQTTATKVSSAVTEKVVPTVNQYVPDEQGRAKIGRFAASFFKNAAFYGLPEVFEYWVPGGVLLYNIALRSLQDVETEDYKQVETKTEHCNEELKKSQAKVNRLERKLSGGGENIQDDVKFESESSVGENNQANDWGLHGFCCCSCVMHEFKCTPESRRYDQNVYDEGI